MDNFGLSSLKEQIRRLSEETHNIQQEIKRINEETERLKEETHNIQQEIKLKAQFP